MNDLENELRELLVTKVGEARAILDAPAQVIRRARRRQVGTILVGALTVTALVAGSIVGLGALIRSQRTDVLGGEGTTRGTIEGVTITYPTNWFLTDPVSAGIEPADTPRTLPRSLLLLSNRDPASSEILGCPGRSDAARGAVLMRIQEQALALSGEGASPWRVPLEPMDGADIAYGDIACYPDWHFYRTSWTAVGRSFEAWVGIAPDASEADQAALFDAFRSMRFERSGDGVVATGPLFTITTGEVGGVSWAFVAYESTEGICVEVRVADGSVGGCGFRPEDLSVSLGRMRAPGGSMLTFVDGTVSRRARSVRIELDGGQEVEASIYPAPPELDVPFAFFVAALPDALPPEEFPVKVVALDGSGNVIAVQAIPSGPDASEAFVELLDKYGNVVGYAPSPEAGLAGGWVPPGDSASATSIRRIADLSLEHFLIPEVSRWWAERPRPDGTDDQFLAWWDAYPVRSDLPGV